MLKYIQTILLLITCLYILFTLINLKRKGLQGDPYRFLLSSFLLTMFLSLVFVFNLHHILRAKLNISNLITYLFYFILVCVFLLKYIKIILRFKYVLIVISISFFGLVIAVDLLTDGKLFVFGYSEFVEYILFILGIIFWLLFFADFTKKIKNS